MVLGEIALGVNCGDAVKMKSVVVAHVRRILGKRMVKNVSENNVRQNLKEMGRPLMSQEKKFEQYVREGVGVGRFLGRTGGL